jgi:hypothetical protein
MRRKDYCSTHYHRSTVQADYDRERIRSAYVFPAILFGGTRRKTAGPSRLWVNKMPAPRTPNCPTLTPNWLFVSQRYHWIHAHRSARRDVACNKRAHKQNRRNS